MKLEYLSILLFFWYVSISLVISVAGMLCKTCCLNTKMENQEVDCKQIHKPDLISSL